MTFTETRDLRKEFGIFKHREGMWGAVRDLSRRNSRILTPSLFTWHQGVRRHKSTGS